MKGPVAMPVMRDLRTLSGTIQQTFTRRNARKQWLTHVAERGPLGDDTFEAAIYYADPPVNLYQLRQWYEPMRRLAQQHPVAIITREVESAAALAGESPLPVVHLQTVSEIEQWVDAQRLGTVFYVNQNTVNFQMMRFHEPAHIFISHGESDKVYMASNQLKAYDFTFVAGDAATERIMQRLIDFDVDRLIPIGRPQADVEYDGPSLPDDGRTVVLYAPTWEGDRPSMMYSSVASHGPAMLSALLGSPKYRVLYRPHPRTGAFAPAYFGYNEALVQLIDEANTADPSAHHRVDTSNQFGWQLAAADVCVCDISAVAFDWLATGKPLLLTEPASEEADVDNNGLVGSVPHVSASEAGRIDAVLDEQLSSATQRDEYAHVVRRYFGDTAPGASMKRFLDAARRIITDRLSRRQRG